MSPTIMHYNIHDAGPGRFLFGVSFQLHQAKLVTPTVTVRSHENFDAPGYLIDESSTFLRNVLRFAKWSYSGIETIEVRKCSLLIEAPVYEIDKLRSILVQLAAHSGCEVSNAPYEPELVAGVD